MSALDSALLAFQSEGINLQKSAINPHFKNRYVPLDTLMGQVLPILNRLGLVLLQFPTTVDVSAPGLRTRITHAESGEFIEDTMVLVLDKISPQAQGSALTYARRYSLMAILGLVADEDSDGAKPAEPVQGSTFNGPDGETYRHEGSGVEGLATQAQLRKLHATVGDLVKLGFDKDALKNGILADHGIGSTKELRKEEAHRVIDTLSKLRDDAAAKASA